MKAEVWIDRVKILLITAVFGSIANCIYTWRLPNLEMVTPIQAAPALLLILAICFASCLVADVIGMFVKAKIPIILYIALITTILSVPEIGGGVATFMQVELAKVQLLPLCTPILAYAGIAVGKDLDTFKTQGLAIVVVAIITFFGTYIGSALIAQLVLTATNVI